jgi:hypothetical protein
VIAQAALYLSTAAAKAAKLAWERTIAFFNEHIR